MINKMKLRTCKSNLTSKIKTEANSRPKYYFALDYAEIPNLNKSLVEHLVPIKSRFKQYKQPP